MTEQYRTTRSWSLRTRRSGQPLCRWSRSLSHGRLQHRDRGFLLADNEVGHLLWLVDLDEVPGALEQMQIAVGE